MSLKHDGLNGQEKILEKIHRETATELSVDVLRKWILSRELKPGSKITENAMADTIGISRATMRQALNTLMVEGLLTRNPTTRVLQVTTLSRADVADIYQARRVLELSGVRAAATASDEQLLLLRSAVQDMEAALSARDIAAFVRADALSHSRNVGFLNSRILIKTHSMLMMRLRLAITQVETADDRDNETVLAEHQVFCSLMQTRETQRAHANLADRLDEAERLVLENLDKEASVRGDS